MQAAMLLADSLQMGHIGVEFVLDADRGPVILEANARPGLSIQIANIGLLGLLGWGEETVTGLAGCRCSKKGPH